MKYLIKNNKSFLYDQNVSIHRIQLIIIISVLIYVGNELIGLELNMLYVFLALGLALVVFCYLIDSFLPRVILTNEILKYKCNTIPICYQQRKLDSIKRILIKGRKEEKHNVRADEYSNTIYTKDIEVYFVDSNTQLMFTETISGESSISKKLIKDRKKALKNFFEDAKFKVVL